MKYCTDCKSLSTGTTLSCPYCNSKNYSYKSFEKINEKKN